MSAGSDAKNAFDAAFFAHFSFTQSDPQAAGITAAEMEDFLNSPEMTDQFLGNGWSNWSSATDETITSRIALNENTPTSISANQEGIQKFAMAAAMVTSLLSGNLSEAARSTVISSSVSMVGETLGGIGQLQSQTGIIQKRVADASDRMKTQVDLFEKHIIDLESVDPTEAATRVANLTDHINTSLALTARLQQLSLLKYLT